MVELQFIELDPSLKICTFFFFSCEQTALVTFFPLNVIMLIISSANNLVRMTDRPFKPSQSSGHPSPPYCSYLRRLDLCPLLQLQMLINHLCQDKYLTNYRPAPEPMWKWTFLVACCSFSRPVSPRHKSGRYRRPRSRI